MNGDPFERFERSRGGILIPVLIFAVGAAFTIAALSGLNDLVSIRDLADQPPAAPAQIEDAQQPEIATQLDEAAQQAPAEQRDETSVRRPDDDSSNPQEASRP